MDEKSMIFQLIVWFWFWNEAKNVKQYIITKKCTNFWKEFKKMICLFTQVAVLVFLELLNKFENKRCYFK